MLDAFIIEEIRRREQERDSQRPRLDVPLPQPTRPKRQVDTSEDEQAPERGVVIIDYSIPASP